MSSPMTKDNEVDEKVMPVAWIVTNGGESCEPWLEYEQSEVDALPSACIADPLYSAATVAELRARADAAERRVGELEAALGRVVRWCDGVHNSPTIRFHPDLHETAAKLKALTGADPT